MMKKATMALWLLLAASTGNALELTLDQCIAQALQNDRELKAETALLEARGEDVAIARKGFFPTLKLSAAYTLYDQPTRLIIDANAFGQGLPAEDVKLSDTDSVKSAQLVLEQPLFTGGELKHNLQKKEAQKDQAYLKLLRRKTLVERDVAEAYFQALNQQMQSQTHEKLLEARRERLRILRERLAEGYAIQDDILTLETDLALAEAELFRSRTRARVALAHLRNRLYLEEGVALPLAAPTFYQGLAGDGPDLKPAAVQSRKDYLALGEQIKGAEAEVKRARSRLYPQVSLVGQYTRQDETNLTRAEVWAAGARLEWSLFEWGKNLAEIRQARAEKQHLQYQREAFARGMESEVEELWGEALALEKIAEALAGKTRSSERLLKTALAQYAEGAVKLDQVLELEAAMVASYHDYLATTNRLGMTLAYLKAALEPSSDDWLTRKELYRPHFEGLSERLEPLAIKPQPAVLAPVVDPAPRTSDAVFAVQLATFTNRKSAEALRQQAASHSKYKPAEIKAHAGTFKVRVGAFDRLEDAQAYLSVVDEALGTKGIVVRTQHDDQGSAR